MAETGRRTRCFRPALNVTLPPKFDATEGVEDEFLTPPIWVAVNPPPIFERPEMKRTVSEASSWQGDEEEPLSPRSTQPNDVENKDNAEVDESVYVFFFDSANDTDWTASAVICAAVSDIFKLDTQAVFTTSIQTTNVRFHCYKDAG
jgi:hypothetical protein